ncbi:fatty-acyl-CoA synthase [Jatrophihabitans sp. GAS493]|uniref:class I adenylate-forming enzyme family protein n=1 Tax=Jatrophihabitans sp. GAS493 TaxID=1907575 RepID=UPI000BB6C626|nr:AMP-binding protein [Jatrophihabitans sp. GAS493]SOD74631.1 fatty-acyl-CoA synthase [Jatrophihabitans sp. GAS493]
MQRPDFGVGQAITRSARLFPTLPCLLDPAGSGRTFAEVEERVNRLANSLAARGVVKATRVAVLSVDTFEYVELFLACLKLGATFVPLNFRLVDEELQTLMGRADADFLFVCDRYVAVGRSLVEALPAPPQLLSLDGSLGDDLSDLISQGDSGEVRISVADDDILIIMFTSGTTGQPKGVLQSHRMVKAVAAQLWECLPKPGEVRYTASPLFHAAGLFVVLGQLTVGCASLITEQFDPQVTDEAMSSGLLTGCFLVPTMINAILDLERPAAASERMRQILYGGAPMPPALLQRALARWPECDFWNLYGSGTESNLQSYLRPEDHRRALAGEIDLLTTVGQSIIGVDLRILDEDGIEVAAGVVGHIAARTDVVMSGYLDDPEETRIALRDGWFFSGDLGYFDEHGYLTLGGRSRDVIIRGGENIYVAEIETVLSRPASVTAAAVVGRPDPYWGELPVAFVEYRGDPPSPLDLELLCRDHLAGYKVPVDFYLLAALPRNGTGKIRKDALRQLAVTPSPSGTAALETITSPGGRS